MIKISILALENCMQSSVTGPFDILSVASVKWKELLSHEKVELFDLKIISIDGFPVTSFNGIKLEPHGSKDDCGKLDVIMIPVIFGDLEPILSNRNLIGWLEDQNKKGVIICAVCAGVFVAAETGLLTGRTVTTHWNLAEDFNARYPDVQLKQERTEKFILFVGAFLVLLFASVLYYMYSILLKRKNIIESTLLKLKLAQDQLVQSQKMAALGVLTSGIAHEINNPLNFIHGSSFLIKKFIEEKTPKYQDELFALQIVIKLYLVC